MNRIILIFALLTVGLVACTSDDITIVETTGIIRDTGDVAVDGCGWVIEINGTQYSPTYLSSQYKQDGLAVFVNVEFLTSTFTCGLTGGLNQIRIEQIRPSGN